MPLHLSTPNKGTMKTPPTKSNGSKLGVNKSASVNRSTTFGLGPGQWKIRDENHAANILENLRIFREKREFTDITFTHDGESFSANRVILAAVSPVMRNVFTKREDLMNAEVIPPEALHLLVLFIYNASCEVKVDVIKKIEKASRVLQIHPITMTCTNLLATIPNSIVKHLLDNDVTSKRLRQIPQNRRASDAMTSSDSRILHHQSSSESKASPEISDDGRVSASDISDVLVGNLKRNSRGSIRLTLHNQTGTPLARSTENIPEYSEGSRSETAECQSLGSSEDHSHFKQRSDSKEPENPEKNPFEKRRRFAMRNNSKLSLLRNTNAKLDGFVSKSPIPLSRLLQNSQELESDTKNRTWPKRTSEAPKRFNLPPEWRQRNNTCATSTSASQPTKLASSDTMKRPISNLQTRDKFVVRFKSRSMPNLLKGLTSLREQGLFCDVTIVVGNVRISCHKSILAASSDVFRTILKEIKSREIVLRKIDESAITEMVKFIYTGQCIIDKDNVFGVMRGSRRFRLHFVARKCANYLDDYVAVTQSFFSLENVLTAYKQAGEYGFQRLRDESKKFAAQRFWDLVHGKRIKELNWVDFSGLINHELVRVSRLRDTDRELQLYFGLISWLQHSPQGRIPHFTAQAMKCVDFFNLSNEALNNIVAKESIVMQHAEVRQRVTEAIQKKSKTIKKLQSLQSLHAQKSLNLDHKEEGEEIHAFVSELKSRTFDETVNRLYSLSRQDESRRPVTSSPVTCVGFAVTSHMGYLYVAGGRDITRNKRVCSDVYRFNHQEGWTKLPNLSLPRSHFSIVSLGGSICAIGGLSENKEKQYTVTTSCEMLELDTNPATAQWKMTSWSLPLSSYSHAATVCILSQKTDASEYKQSKEENKMKAANSPTKRRGFRLNSPFFEVKSPLLNRIAPKPSSGKTKKSSLTGGNMKDDLLQVLFVCGGKTNPRQLLLFSFDSSKFVEKSNLPCPSTKPSLVSRYTMLYLACDDVMETSQYRLFQYNICTDQWNELVLPESIERPLNWGADKLNSDTETHPSQTCISALSTTSGICFAVCLKDVIVVEQFDLTSASWKRYEQTKLESSATDFMLCTL